MEKRLILTISLCMVLFFSWSMLGQFLGYQMNAPEETQTEQVETQQPDGLPTPSGLDPSSPVETPSVAGAEGATPENRFDAIPQETVTLENDVLRLKFDNRGAVMRGATLKQYYTSAKEEQNVQLIHPRTYYPGEIILPGDKRTDYWMFEVEKRSDREVSFVTENESIRIQKTYTLTDQYKVVVATEVSGLDLNYKMVISEGLQPVLANDKLVPSFFDFGEINPKVMRIAWSEDGTHEEQDISKLEAGLFGPLLDEPEKVVWLGIQDTYFANVFMPEQPADNVFLAGVTHKIGGREPFVLPAVAIDGNNSLKGSFFMGPTEENTLEAADARLENLVSYGWAGLLSKGLFILLSLSYDLTGNWGWAIVVLTLFIRLILMPLAIPSMKSSIKMRKLQPKMEKIKQKYSDDDDFESKMKMQQEMQKLFKEEGVNHFASCFAMLPQMPIFFAYFSLLRSSISLRQADWMFWINDLSVKDPYYVLPILMAASMFLTSLSMPMAGMDPTQQRMMKFMPLAFAVFFISMPSGLVLYMITGNIFMLVQNFILRRRYENS
ncbi:membrane protein insertase YidC [Acanthopleuribacter pedis]|uniref:Membrane protein insertase YidC n=1 Tax=Acanthopleuribacter pedis TaxID=442870 RepID=A0A8J7QG44_9BACT|nr:membrane protein insertase YidC [Acanthopleuribacter pedis]MBO1317890.1 membrane protein insertase YidC [Acanthopleuribacter pedis]